MNVPKVLIRNMNHSWKNFCTVIRNEIKVQPFCDINVKVPYNVNIKPLDVFKYQNCDSLQFEIEGSQAVRKTMKHVQEGNNIKLFATTEVYDQDAVCNIHAPVKANLHIEAQGNISTGGFGGSKLFLKSTKGSIFVDKYQGELIDLNTEAGDIILKGAIVASKIKVTVNQDGCIKTKRLQGFNADLKTHQGDIHVDCSYCDNATFHSDWGNLDLQNIHKCAKIYLKDGKLTMSGLDGTLEANLHNSEAEIQISRILGDSKITMTEEGQVKLLLSEDCQNNTLFEIIAKGHTLDPSIRLIPSRSEDNTLYLMPTGDDYKQVRVKCEMGQVHIQSASWINMLKLNVKK